MRQGRAGSACSETFHDLGEVLARVPEPAVVVLGPPGSGKSTLLRHYELDCAHAALAGQAGADLSQAPVTFFVSLSDYKPASANASLPTPQDWLAAQWAARYPELPGLDVLLRQRRLTLLLDALNEIPVVGAEAVQQWKEFLRQLERDFPGNRVVFSCRHLDYSVTLSSKELPVPQVRIEPLSNAQVQEFVTVYCPEHGATLWQNLAGHPAVRAPAVPVLPQIADGADHGRGNSGWPGGAVHRLRAAGLTARSEAITRCCNPMACCTSATCSASTRSPSHGHHTSCPSAVS